MRSSVPPTRSFQLAKVFHEHSCKLHGAIRAPIAIAHLVIPVTNHYDVRVFAAALIAIRLRLDALFHQSLN
jgi:hypothetical protein